MMTLARLVQPAKAVASIPLTPSEIETLVRFEQFLNAELPILFTLLGISIFERLVQP